MKTEMSFVEPNDDGWKESRAYKELFRCKKDNQHIYISRRGESSSHLRSGHKGVRGGDADAVSHAGVVQLLSGQNVCRFICDGEHSL